MVGLLSGVYRLGKRPVRHLLADLFGLSISTGMICKLQRRAAVLLAPAYDQLLDHVRTQNAHLDETGWREDKKRAWLWTVVVPLVTIFHIARSRGRDVVEQLLGPAFLHVVTCDRSSAYGHSSGFSGVRRLRDFQAMIDRGGPARPTGEALLEHSDHLFHWWHRVRDGTLYRATFQTHVGWLRSAVRDDLESGTSCGLRKNSGHLPGVVGPRGAAAGPRCATKASNRPTTSPSGRCVMACYGASAVAVLTAWRAAACRTHPKCGRDVPSTGPQRLGLFDRVPRCCASWADRSPSLLPVPVADHLVA